MTEEQKTLLIERYLKGELTDAERQEVERMIENDTQFAEDVSVMRLVLTTLEDRDAVQFHRQVTAAWDAEDEDEKEEPESEQPSGPGTLRVGWSRRYWLLAAALFLSAAAIGVWQYYRSQPAAPVAGKQETTKQQEQAPVPPPPHDTAVKPAPPARPQAQNTPQKPKPNPRYIAMAQRYYATAPDFSNIRKIGDNMPVDSLPPLQRAQRAFADRQYEKVIQLLAKPDANVRGSALYLRGHAHFNAGHYEAAARDFQTLFEINGLDVDNAGWYLLLSKLALYGPGSETVRTQLKIIADDSGHPFNAEAKKLQAEINR